MTTASFWAENWKKENLQKIKENLSYRDVDRDRDLKRKKNNLLKNKIKKKWIQTNRRLLPLRDRCFERRCDLDRERVLRENFDIFIIH